MSTLTKAAAPYAPQTGDFAKPTEKRQPGAPFLALIIIASILPFLPALKYGFVSDDDVQVVQTVAVRTWQTPWFYFVSSVWALHGSLVGNTYYRPLFQTWLRVNAVLFGTNALAWHLSAILPHLIVTLLVFSLIRRYVPNPWYATIGTLIFSIHPTHIESVVWVSGADDPLMAVALLGSFLLWLKKGDTGRRSLWAGSLLCYAVALLFKETAIMLPAIVFAYALLGIYPLDAPRPTLSEHVNAAFRESTPFAAIALTFWALRTAVVHHTLGVGKLAWVSPWHALLTAPGLLFFYLRHLVCPLGLRLYYQYAPVMSVWSTTVWLPLLVLLIIGCATVVWAWRRPDWAVLSGAIWILAPLLPVLNIGFLYRDDFVHDRYLYLPCIGLGILASAAAEWLLSRKTSRWKRLAAVTATALVLGTLGGLTVTESEPWQDNLALYSHNAKNSNNTAARLNLANEYTRHGRLEEAQTMLESLRQERPNDWLVIYDLGYVKYRLRDLDAAGLLLDRSIALNPSQADSYLYRGMVYLRKGQFAQARAYIQRAIAIDPSGEGYHFALATLLLPEHNDDAKAELREELRYHPKSGLAKMELASLNRAQPQKNSSGSSAEKTN